MDNKETGSYVKGILHRTLLILFNVCLAVTGLIIIDSEQAVSYEMVEIAEMPSEAAYPFRQLTREEKARQFFEELRIDTSHLKLSTVSLSLDPWQPYIDEYAAHHKVDPRLVGAIVYAESKGDPFRISHDGALGLMQIMPKTAVYLGYDDMLDPEENIKAGVKYISRLVNRYGETYALWAWNAGPSRVDRRHIPRETRKFIVEVLSVKKFLEDSQQFDDIS